MDAPPSGTKLPFELISHILRLADTTAVPYQGTMAAFPRRPVMRYRKDFFALRLVSRAVRKEVEALFPADCDWIAMATLSHAFAPANDEKALSDEEAVGEIARCTLLATASRLNVQVSQTMGRRLNALFVAATALRGLGITVRKGGEPEMLWTDVDWGLLCRQVAFVDLQVVHADSLHGADFSAISGLQSLLIENVESLSKFSATGIPDPTDRPTLNVPTTLRWPAVFRSLEFHDLALTAEHGARLDLSGAPLLTALHFALTQATVEGVRALHLGRLRHLKALRIEAPEYSDGVIGALELANTSVRDLVLTSPARYPAFVEANLSDMSLFGLATNKHLQHLAIHKISLQSLNFDLHLNSTLTTLDLNAGSLGRLTPSQFTGFATELVANTRLETLSLAMNDIRDEHVHDFDLGRSTSLKSLSLSYNLHITDVGVRSMHLERISTLRFVGLDATSTTKQYAVKELGKGRIRVNWRRKEEVFPYLAALEEANNPQ